MSRVVRTRRSSTSRLRDAPGRDVTKCDKVLLRKFADTEIQLEGEEHLIIREDDVLAVLE